MSQVYIGQNVDNTLTPSALHVPVGHSMHYLQVLETPSTKIIVVGVVLQVMKHTITVVFPALKGRIRVMVCLVLSVIWVGTLQRSWLQTALLVWTAHLENIWTYEELLPMKIVAPVV